MSIMEGKRRSATLLLVRTMQNHKHCCALQSPLKCRSAMLTFRVHACCASQVGSKLTTAVDSFSFGIMMWELYTGQRAYGGLGRDAIIDRVYKKKARPIFPLGECMQCLVFFLSARTLVCSVLQRLLAA